MTVHPIKTMPPNLVSAFEALMVEAELSQLSDIEFADILLTCAFLRLTRASSPKAGAAFIIGRASLLEEQGPTGGGDPSI
ncbi:hypothetical protein [Alloyangia pacifica]|uniref:hypothetical protein n=1 Tax=Alloyangia pacifica TaxID=311180 RepID=UPI001CFE974B|nr:hypothetical protein [Alloyangia pacifica]